MSVGQIKGARRRLKVRYKAIYAKGLAANETLRRETVKRVKVKKK